jgi:hypothetical protein
VQSSLVATPTDKGCAAMVMMQRGMWKEVLAEALPEVNAQMRRVATMNMDLSGSTAITAFLSPTGSLTVGNLGDSRCVVGAPPPSPVETRVCTQAHLCLVRLHATAVRHAACSWCASLCDSSNKLSRMAWL